MSNIINSEAYVKHGDKVYKVNGGAVSPIHTFNSVEEMNAANLPDGTIACVPSSGESGGGGGLPVVEVTSCTLAGCIDNPYPLSESESAAMENISGETIILKVFTKEDVPLPIALVLVRSEFEGTISYTGSWLTYIVAVGYEEGAWSILAIYGGVV